MVNSVKNIAAEVDGMAGGEEAANNSGSAGAGGGKCNQLTLTPRFTQEEKEILYSLFHQHQEVIDIKFRKKQRSKFSVRDAWETIATEFNSHPAISAMRNIKQIQKFWLNARLRKQYPFTPADQRAGGHNGNAANDGGNAAKAGGNANSISNPSIKSEPDLHLVSKSEEDVDPGDGYIMEMDANGLTQLDDEMDSQEEEEHQAEEPHQQTVQPTATTQHHLHAQQQHHQPQQQPQQQQQQQLQQISVDQISAEKLTLTDLLQFKTARPREEIILQIKHPSDGTTGTAQITIPSPTRITLPTHHSQHPQQHTMATITASGYNQQIISEIKPQQITLAQYQAQQQQQQQQHHQHQQQLVVQQQQQLTAQQQLAAAVQQQQQQQHTVKMQLQSPVTQQFANGTPTFTFNAVPATVTPVTLTTPATIAAAAAAAATVQQHHQPQAQQLQHSVSATAVNDAFDEKIQYFKLKEAELRYKEQQVALEKKRIELSHAQETLKHLKDLHRLQVEEMKLKISILQEEEKQLMRQTQSALPT